MNTWPRAVIAAFLLCTLASCVAGTPDSKNAMDEGWLYELILGFWHGIIAFFTLIVGAARALLPEVSIPHWRMYEPGGATIVYDVGFFLGIGSHLSLWWGRPWTYWRVRRRV